MLLWYIWEVEDPILHLSSRSGYRRSFTTVIRVAWRADDPHYLAANVVHDDEEGFERRCVLEHLSLRRNSQDGGSVCLSAT